MVGQVLFTVELAVILLAAMLLGGCTTLTEIGNSSGCLYSTGGPVPGMASGVVVLCRSGKDKSSVEYSDNDGRKITIRHN